MWTEHGGHRRVSFSFWCWADSDGVVHDEVRHFEVQIRGDKSTVGAYKRALAIDSLAAVRVASSDAEPRSFALASESPSDPKLKSYQELVSTPSEPAHWAWVRPSANFQGDEERKKELFDHIDEAGIPGLRKLRATGLSSIWLYSPESDLEVTVVHRKETLQVTLRDLSDPMVGRSDHSALEQILSKLNDRAVGLGLSVVVNPRGQAVPDLFRNRSVSVPGLGDFIPSYAWDDSSAPLVTMDESVRKYWYWRHRSTRPRSLPLLGYERPLELLWPSKVFDEAAASFERLFSSPVFEVEVVQAIWQNYLEERERSEADGWFDDFVRCLLGSVEKSTVAALPVGPEDILHFVTEVSGPIFAPGFYGEPEVRIPLQFAWDPGHQHALEFDGGGRLKEIGAF